MFKRGSVSRVVLGLATAVLIHASAQAETAEGETSVPPGSRVRVTFNRPDAKESQVTGEVRELGQASLSLSLDSSDCRRE